MIRKIKRQWKWWMQRHTRGFDDKELWNLDGAIADFILPRLKAYKEYKKQGDQSYPNGMNSSEEWYAAIDKMIWFWEWKANHCFLYPQYKNEQEKYEEGKVLFMQYLDHLWD